MKGYMPYKPTFSDNLRDALVIPVSILSLIFLGTGFLAPIAILMMIIMVIWNQTSSYWLENRETVQEHQEKEWQKKVKEYQKKGIKIYWLLCPNCRRQINVVDYNDFQCEYCKYKFKGDFFKNNG